MHMHDFDFTLLNLAKFLLRNSNVNTMIKILTIGTGKWSRRISILTV